MERIVIEVDDKLAKAWQRASESKKKTLGNKVSLAIAKELIPNNKNEYLTFLNETRAEMKDNGLTQEALSNILNNG